MIEMLDSDVPEGPTKTKKEKQEYLDGLLKSISKEQVLHGGKSNKTLEAFKGIIKGKL